MLTGGGGVQNGAKNADIINERPLIPAVLQFVTIIIYYLPVLLPREPITGVHHASNHFLGENLAFGVLSQGCSDMECGFCFLWFFIEPELYLVLRELALTCSLVQLKAKYLTPSIMYKLLHLIPDSLIIWSKFSTILVVSKFGYTDTTSPPIITMDFSNSWRASSKDSTGSILLSKSSSSQSFSIFHCNFSSFS